MTRSCAVRERRHEANRASRRTGVGVKGAEGAEGAGEEGAEGAEGAGEGGARGAGEEGARRSAAIMARKKMMDGA